MTTQEIVSKLWSLCNFLRDDGITYYQYVTELTYILFLKMASGTGAEEKMPKGYCWENLSIKSGIELKKILQGVAESSRRKLHGAYPRNLLRRVLQH